MVKHNVLGGVWPISSSSSSSSQSSSRHSSLIIICITTTATNYHTSSLISAYLIIIISISVYVQLILHCTKIIIFFIIFNNLYHINSHFLSLIFDQQRLYLHRIILIIFSCSHNF